MRKSIFELVAEKVNSAEDIKRIITMFEDEKTVKRAGYYSIKKYVDEYCFRDWSWRNHFIDVNDYLKALDYNGLKKNAPVDIDSMLTLIELVYNFWNLTNEDFYDEDISIYWCGNFHHIKTVMDDLLQQYNYTAYEDEENDCILIIEDKAEVTSVAEILPSSLSFDIIKYNHRSLKGELDVKKSILISLGAELEPKRKDLQTINKQLSEDIFFMLNNINIRHNNRSKKDKSKYKEYVAKMKKPQLERWYDELYQMILLAFLLLDNLDRADKVKELKSKIVETK